MPDLEAGVEEAKYNRCKIYACGCCCGSFCLGSIVGLIFLLCSITSLGPEEQVIIYGPDGKYVGGNGPATLLITPLRKKEYRRATRLGPREYAVLKHTRTGSYRHYPGPALMFIGAYEVIDDRLQKIVLQKHEYMRLVDRMTGVERVVSGPETVVPFPLETSPDGTETAIVLGTSLAVLTLNKTSGVKRLVTEGGVFVPAAYEVVDEVREATLVGPHQFARVKNDIEGLFRHVEGPQLLHVGAYERLINVRPKIVLEKDQYIRLLDQSTGRERIERGPNSFVPQPSEVYPEGVQRARFLDTDTSILVLNETSGQEHIVTQRGVFVPKPEEEILETRQLIQLLPHEFMLVPDDKGSVTVYGGDSGVSAFFLPPYAEIVVNEWSDYGAPPVDGIRHNSTKVGFTKLDIRMRKMFFRYDVRTSDNVQLQLDGTIFWRLTDVSRMINKTSDPEGDVWHHARSALIQAVSQSALQVFMSNFNNITMEAFGNQAADGFYSDRGVMLSSMELTRFRTTDTETNAILQTIIQETSNRVSALEKQKGQNEVNAARLSAEISYETQNTKFIEAQATNERLSAKTEGEAAGTVLLRAADSFIGGLHETVENVTTRVELYKLHKEIRGHNEDVKNLATGKAELFFVPPQVNLILVKGGAKGASPVPTSARRIKEVADLDDDPDEDYEL